MLSSSTKAIAVALGWHPVEAVQLLLPIAHQLTLSFVQQGDHAHSLRRGSCPLDAMEQSAAAAGVAVASDRTTTPTVNHCRSYV